MTLLAWAVICILAGVVWTIVIELGRVRGNLAAALVALSTLQQQLRGAAQAADGARLVADAAMQTAMQARGGIDDLR